LTGAFEKDIKKIKDKAVLRKVASAIRHTRNASDLSGIRNLKKLSTSGNEYRIRIGDHRIGIVIEDDTVIFVRCLHRKDIYKYFPK